MHLCGDMVIHKHIVMRKTAEKMRIFSMPNNSILHLFMLNAWQYLVHMIRHLEWRSDVPTSITLPLFSNDPKTAKRIKYLMHLSAFCLTL